MACLDRESLCGVASSNFVVAFLSETGNPSELPSQRDIVHRESLRKAALAFVDSSMSAPAAPPRATPQRDPVLTAMVLAAEHPEKVQQAAAMATTAVDAAKRADPSGEGNLKGGAKVIAGAALVGGVAVGAVAGSLAIGIVAAAGAAYTATRSDKAGDAARATGQAAVAVAGKAEQLNREHQITDKIVSAAKTGYVKADQLNREHHITDKIVSAAKTGYHAVKELDQKHGITSKTADALIAAANGITKKVDKSGGSAPEAASMPPPPPPPPEGHTGVYRPPPKQ